MKPCDAFRSLAVVILAVSAFPAFSSENDAYVEAHCGGGIAAVRVGVGIHENGAAEAFSKRIGRAPQLRRLRQNRRLALEINAQLDAVSFDRLGQKPSYSGLYCSLARRTAAGSHTVRWPRQEMPPHAIAPVFERIMRLLPEDMYRAGG